MFVFFNKMMKGFQCKDNKWLRRLYDIREKWCIAFSNKVFSGGILSSQCGESTNRALSLEMKKTSRLAAFFKNFMQVCRKWRDHEIEEDYKSLNGEVKTKFPGVQILIQARKIYTAGAYSTFLLFHYVIILFH